MTNKSSRKKTETLSNMSMSEKGLGEVWPPRFAKLAGGVHELLSLVTTEILLNPAAVVSNPLRGNLRPVNQRPLFGDDACQTLLIIIPPCSMNKAPQNGTLVIIRWHKQSQKEVCILHSGSSNHNKAWTTNKNIGAGVTGFFSQTCKMLF